MQWNNLIVFPVLLVSKIALIYHLTLLLMPTLLLSPINQNKIHPNPQTLDSPKQNKQNEAQ